jgi:peptide/nickel transport system substrate-binding protein
MALAQARGGPTVSIGLSLEPDSLDPTMAASATIGEVVHYNVLEGLTRIEENGQVRPLLAHSWSQDASGLVHVFKLRRGVRYHDGAVFDAQAVRFSFERAKAPGSTNKARKALFDNIARIDTPDAHTVVLTLERPDVHLLFHLGESPAVVLHPASASQAASHPVGTGPYRFAQWVRGQSITLVKAETYRNAAQVGMERAVFHFMPDQKVQEAAFREGGIDVFFNLATQDVGHFQGDSRYQVLVGSSTGKGMVAINHRRKPLNDVRVRRAITHAIDREAFIRKVLQGRARAIGSHFAPTDPGYVHLAGVYPYSPERARSLLQEAGVALPLRLTLTLPPTPYAREGGPIIAADLAKVGIEARLEAVEWSQWLGGVFKGQFDLSLITHVESLDYLIYTDPSYYFGYDSPEFRHLAARHALASNPRERNRLFAQMQRHLAEDAANAWIFAPQVATVARKGLRGVWMNYPLVVHDIAAMRWE